MQSLLLVAQNGKNEVTIALTGDIMMGTTYPSVQLPTREGRQLFIHAEPVLKRADLAAGNLEGTLCDSGSTRKKPGKASFAFRTPTSYVERLKEAGYDFLSLANNHSYDFGQIGVHSTINSLRTQGIAFAGIKEYPASVIVERNGVRYGLCAFGHNAYTYRHQDLESVRRIITDLVNNSDVVIVSFHGGAEGVALPVCPTGKKHSTAKTVVHCATSRISALMPVPMWYSGMGLMCSVLWSFIKSILSLIAWAIFVRLLV